MDIQVYSKRAAERFGLEAAVLLSRIYFCVRKNSETGKHYHDGRYWMYNSVRSWHEDMPYLSEKKIRNTLKELIDAGMILTGRYNKCLVDRTLWYTVTDAAIALIDLPADAGTDGDIFPLPRSV